MLVLYVLYNYSENERPWSSYLVTIISLIFTGQFKKRLQEKHEAIKALNKMEIVLNPKGKYVADLEDELAGIAGSFRQLQVDWLNPVKGTSQKPLQTF